MSLGSKQRKGAGRVGGLAVELMVPLLLLCAPTTAADLATLTGCYDDPFFSQFLIQNCTCDSSCQACRYTNSFNPPDYRSCVTCSNGGVVYPYLSDGTNAIGFCLEPTATGCFDSEGQQLPNCNCHESCATCGFYDDPTYADDCWTCAAGGRVYPVYSDGTGLCLEPTATGCFDSEGQQLPNCNCHESCATCGFYDNPTEADDCWTCAAGCSVTPVYEDGTGICNCTSTTSSSKSKKSSGSHTPGVIAGIAVGAAAVLIIAAAVAYWLVCSSSTVAKKGPSDVELAESKASETK